jgi:hypothetical protein
MTSFHNKRELRCSSRDGPADAKSKLLGYITFLQAGMSGLPPVCQVRKCYTFPSTFKHYILLQDADTDMSDADMDDADPPDCDGNQLDREDMDEDAADPVTNPEDDTAGLCT